MTKIEMTCKARDLVKEKLKEEKVKLGTITKQANVDHATAWKWLNGKHHAPRFETVMRLMNVLGINPADAWN